MGHKRAAGLQKRNGVWHIDKMLRGRRICESTGTGELAAAEDYLARKIDEARQASMYGTRPRRTFRSAATKYVLENQHKRCIADEAWHLKLLDPIIGDLPLESIHMGTLRSFVTSRQSDGVKTKTINLSLGVVRHILNVAASEWIDEHDLTWLAAAPKIKLLRVTDARKPYPLSWEEQSALFAQLPEHLAGMALFAVNTGLRNREVCGLQWDWEIPVSALDTSVFMLPAERIKNGEERLVVLNRIAKSVVDGRRGLHAKYLFTFRDKPIETMHNTAWQKARIRAGLPQVRVHDLKHTFGRRLRAAGVSFEDRQDLLGHKSSRVTTHYSGPELYNLIEAANRVCEEDSRKIHALVMLKQKAATALAVTA